MEDVKLRRGKRVRVPMRDEVTGDGKICGVMRFASDWSIVTAFELSCWADVLN